MEPLKINVAGTQLEISSMILISAAAQEILDTYPVDKLTATRLICYAYLMVSQTDTNPYINITNEIERSHAIQLFFFGKPMPAVEKDSVKTLIKQFKTQAKYATKRKRVETARLVVAKLKSYIESFDIQTADVEGMKNFSEIGIKLEKNEAILADAEKAMTAAVNEDIEEGNFVMQLYD